ncbi:MAG: aminotransferase class V-fold PLP-dependent enzyme [Haloarculaceae archaeon]
MDPRELRADTPALTDCTYLNFGASGPSPRRVVAACQSFQAYHAYESPAEEGMYGAAVDCYDEVRPAIADLLGCAPESVALTQSTTDGINRVASALDWQRGDVVVRTDLEHSAGILPWQRRRDRYGVEIRSVPCPDGRLDVDAYATAVADAKLVCLSALTWTHGTYLDVARAVEIAHEAGALVLVDAVQMPGQTAMDVTEWGADFVAAAGHKWLLGPWGAGFVYVRPEVIGELEPDRIGYRSAAEKTDDDYELHADARRLEVGTVSPAPYAGLQTAIETWADVGYETVESRIAALTERLKDGIPADRLYSPREFESGLVTFRADDPEALVERAADAGVMIRSLPKPEGAVRASIHAVNTEADVEALLDLL